jgi:hypothetical protein
VTTTSLREQPVERTSGGVEAASVSHRIAAVLGWVGVTIVFAIVLELACRVEDWVLYRAPIVSRYTQLNDLIVRDADGMHGRPNARYMKWEMNALGTRGPEASVKPAAGTIRIVTVGASETFGLRESPGKEYPRQLEDSLNARAARTVCASGKPAKYEVLNAGFAGMSLPTIRQDLRTRIRRLQPAMILVYPTPVQYLEEAIPYPAKPDSSGRDVGPPASHALHPRVVDRMREQIKQVLPEWVKTRLRARETRALLQSRPADWRFAGVPTDRLQDFDSDLRQTIGTIREIGAVPVLATHGNIFMGRGEPDHDMLIAWEKFYPRATGATIVAFDSTARHTTLKIGADSGVTTIDAATRLAKAPVSEFGDFVHFTDSGAADMADIISAAILSTSVANACALAGSSSSPRAH